MGEDKRTINPLKCPDIVLGDYGFSEELGFILENPLDRLPPYFDPWMELVKKLDNLRSSPTESMCFIP